MTESGNSPVGNFDLENTEATAHVGSCKTCKLVDAYVEGLELGAISE
jgi:hypothetical protein